MKKKPNLRIVKDAAVEDMTTEDLIKRFELDIERGDAIALSMRYKDSAARQELFNRGENPRAISAINVHLGCTFYEDGGFLIDAWNRLRDEIIAANPDLKIKVRKPQKR